MDARCGSAGHTPSLNDCGADMTMANPTESEARVVTTFGRRFELATTPGNRRPARIKGRKLRPVCGDRVLARPPASTNEPDWLITSIQPRDNELTRPDLRGRTEVLAANVSLLVIVAAARPKPDWFIVDRYLSAAELIGAKAAVVINKQDLDDTAIDDTVLSEYRDLGYPVLVTSAETGAGLDALRELLRNETAIFVGQSGVGKSSLINSMISDAELRTGAVSEKSGEGRHTTVNSLLIDLPEGGAVIDSPGVRDYAPSIDAIDRVATGFREIADAAAGCRYANCRHMREPDCAVKAAVEAGSIAGRRYDSYKRLVHLTESLQQRR